MKKKKILLAIIIVGLAMIILLSFCIIKTAKSPQHSPKLEIGWTEKNNSYYYKDKDGEIAIGWKWIESSKKSPNSRDWCYFDDSGKYITSFPQNYSDMSGIIVSIPEQKLYLLESGNIALDYHVITGTKGKDDTPTGEYKILNKKENSHISGPDWDYDIERWMGFIGSEYGFHDAWWQEDKLFDDPESYLTNGSHGCVNMRTDDIKLLYDRVSEGTMIRIIE